MNTVAKTGYALWQDGLKRAPNDPQWSIYDCDIKTAVSEFDHHLSKTQHYRRLDWHLVKAMLWVETGAASPEWKTKPMQIGVAGDPGLAALLSSHQGGELILPKALRDQFLKARSAATSPAHNIRAGMAYLLMRLAVFRYDSIEDPKPNLPFKVTVQPHDSLTTIAARYGSTVPILKSLNAHFMHLKPGQSLQVKKGAIKHVISNWQRASIALVAQRYNGGGDPLYAKKLNYALSLIKKGKGAVCE
jgi:LysM repeat protein